MNDINEILNETSGLYNDAQTTLENVLVLRENVSKIVNETLPDVDNKILDNKNKINNHINDKDNPHNVTKEQVGLGNVVNERQYSSENQPPYPVTSVASKTGAVTLEKTDVGLGNVDNTSDLDKPISTATQSALDEKLNTSNVVQETGTNETDVMSQKAVTEQLATKQDTLTAGNGITIENNTISASASGGLQQKTAHLYSVLTYNTPLKTKEGVFRSNLQSTNLLSNILKVSKGEQLYFTSVMKFRLVDKDSNITYMLASDYTQELAIPVQPETDKYYNMAHNLTASMKLSCFYSDTIIFDITINMRSSTSNNKNLFFLPIKVIKRVVDTSTGIITETQLPNCEFGITSTQSDVDLVKIWYE